MKDKKGISPVIATLLLVVIAVAAAIIVYAWTTLFTTMQTGRAGTVIAAESVIKVQKVVPPYDNNKHTYTFNLTVRNLGSTDVSITEFYLNGTVLSFTGGYSEIPPAGVWVMKGVSGWGDTAISPGFTGLIRFTACLRKGYPCIVRVSTGQGAYTDISFYPP
ncbi:MAG: archaellin/type IV pilin N-terminal domain-containing protein [Candidatus Nezhaarchaeales archaeon]